MFYVYIHTLPNGKIYVGETKDPKSRWFDENNYKGNKRFYKAIEEYGWDNVKHEIVCSCESEMEARIYEALLIYMLDSENESVGYNQSSYKKKVEERYASRVVSGDDMFDKPIRSKNVLEESGLPVSACTELIDQWIFNDRYRKIAKDKFINGMTFDDLSKKYKLSVRQLKNIIYDCRVNIETHI